MEPVYILSNYRVNLAPPFKFGNRKMGFVRFR
jgi:hypothetical protein